MAAIPSLNLYSLNLFSLRLKLDVGTMHEHCNLM